MDFTLRSEQWELKQPFRITGREWLYSECLVIEITDNGSTGRGEAQGVSYLGESTASMTGQIQNIANDLRSGLTRHELATLLPAGGARNAVDCALWDLEAKQRGQSIWQLTGIDPKPVTTVFTIGMEASPGLMAEKAAAARAYPVLKIKLDGNQPYERLAAIREARPDARLVVDVNQGWSFAQLMAILPQCAGLGLDMIEQPLPRGADQVLDGFDSPVTLAADESCQDTSELEIAARRYDMINIKLDKTGGLTEALQLVRLARERGCKLMVGNMLGTSLGMAPSFVVAQLCDFVDLDGPLLMRHDREFGMHYNDAIVEVFDSRLWG